MVHLGACCVYLSAPNWCQRCVPTLLRYVWLQIPCVPKALGYVHRGTKYSCFAVAFTVLGTKYSPVASRTSAVKY
jgi:hypothetical protein